MMYIKDLEIITAEERLKDSYTNKVTKKPTWVHYKL